jgi:hypothetical protein
MSMYYHHRQELRVGNQKNSDPVYEVLLLFLILQGLNRFLPISDINVHFLLGFENIFANCNLNSSKLFSVPRTNIS